MSPQPATTSTTTNENQPFDPRAKGALKHGLTGARIYFETKEEFDAFDNLRDALLADLAPSGDIETNLALQIVNDRYRLERAATIENIIFFEGCPENPMSQQFKLGEIWQKESKNLALLSLYESRIQRRFEKNMALLEHLQTNRQASLQAAIAEAVAIQDAAQPAAEAQAEAAQAGETAAATDPETAAADTAAPFRTRNFDFSKAEIAVLLARHRLLSHPPAPAKRLARPAKTAPPLELAA